MSECAFCPHTAKLSGEHIWSRWMGKLFNIKKVRFIQRDEAGDIVRHWPRHEVDLTATVVCKPCNEGWMSHLEQHYAKPAMEDLIVGKTGLIPLQPRAHAIARFAFKTAVIVDHMRRDEPFFPRHVRHHFAKSLKVPRDVQMWLAGYLPVASGRVYGCYHEMTLENDGNLTLYVCTYGVGHFVFQVVAAKHKGIPSFEPRPGFENLAVPFWPTIPHGVRWPPSDVLRTTDEFWKFSERWSAIKFV